MDALRRLEAALAADPDDPAAWLRLGDLREVSGQPLEALQAWFQAVTRAQMARQWIDRDSTPTELMDSVVRAIEQVRMRRRELYFGSFETLRAEHGAESVARVERALRGYLREVEAKPADPRQRPRFFYFPDLPPVPYLDPLEQPWAGQLLESFEDIRDEALDVLREGMSLQDFVHVRKGDSLTNYLGGPSPSWEAYFFYRHGERFDDNHARCPLTSRALGSIELCRIAGHAPEICFSVLKPDTHILPHYGVTNVRSVMHLPLLVPPDCALNILGAGEHVWREGELVMFDDTFQHEAWNRSKSVRVVLLMDCWHPGLTAVERLAVTRLIETIGALHGAARAAGR